MVELAVTPVSVALTTVTETMTPVSAALTTVTATLTPVGTMVTAAPTMVYARTQYALTRQGASVKSLILRGLTATLYAGGRRGLRYTCGI